MAEITQAELNRLLKSVTYHTYLLAIRKATPGRADMANAWKVRIDDDAIVIYNEEFGDIIKYLEEGTSPHIIKAKPGKFLAFKWPDAPIKPHLPDGTFFFKKIHHPGIEARRFIEEVISDKSIQTKWDKMFSDRLEKLIKTKYK